MVQFLVIVLFPIRIFCIQGLLMAMVDLHDIGLMGFGCRIMVLFSYVGLLLRG